MNKYFKQPAIIKYWLFSLFSQMLFLAPVLVLFYKDNGLNMTQILLLQSVFAVSIVILEVPTGIIADRFGKKNSIIAGSFFFSLGLFVYGASYGFFGFLVSEIIAGTGFALISGADSAYIHAILKSSGRTADYKRIEGTAFALKLFGGLIAGGILGGLIAHFSLRATLYASAIATACAFFISLTLDDTGKESKKKTDSPLMHAFGSIAYIKKKPSVLWIFLFSSIICGLGWQFIWYIQPMFESAHIPIIHFGWMYAILGLTAVIASRYTHVIDSFLGDTLSLMTIPLLLILSSLFLSLTPPIIALFSFILVEIQFGMSRTIVSDALLHQIPSSKAATILSMNNLGLRLISAISGPLFGLVADRKGNQTMFMCLGIVLTIFCVILFIFRRASGESTAQHTITK
jgi:predicted MFS family arabinose efflux permease